MSVVKGEQGTSFVALLLLLLLLPLLLLLLLLLAKLLKRITQSMGIPNM